MSSQSAQTYSKDQFHHIIENAKELLAFAVETGIEVDADTAQKIITADKVGGHDWPAGPDGAPSWRQSPNLLLNYARLPPRRFEPVGTMHIRQLDFIEEYPLL